MDQHDDDAELMRKATELGLHDLALVCPADLRRALQNGKALASRLPTDLHWTEEPAHTFSLVPSKGERRP